MTKIAKQLKIIKDYLEVQEVFFPFRTEFSGQEINQLLNNHGIGMDSNVRKKVIEKGIFTKKKTQGDRSLTFYL